jgi:pyrrolidone-carboxylate peptidase
MKKFFARTTLTALLLATPAFVADMPMSMRTNSVSPCSEMMSDYKREPRKQSLDTLVIEVPRPFSSRNEDFIRKQDVLITGFAPYNSLDVNMSGEIARYLSDYHGYDVLILNSDNPRQAFDSVQSVIKEKRKKVVISLGKSAKISGVSFPYAANNIVVVNDSVYENIDDDLPLYAMYPTKSIADVERKMKTARMHFELEDNPGQHACNYFAYKMMQEAWKKEEYPARQLFFHVSSMTYDYDYLQSWVRFIRLFHN